MNRISLQSFRLGRPAFGLVVLSTVSLAIGSLAESAESPATDLSWLAGDWVGGDEDSFIQEQWSLPHGGDMMGMFRLIQGGKVVFYEFMTLTLGASGTTLRIKHFDPGLIGWEQKDDSVVFELVASGDQRATFETLAEGQPERLVFERAGDELTITLEKPAKGTSTPFRYRLRAP